MKSDVDFELMADALSNRDGVSIDELFEFTSAGLADYYRFLYLNGHMVAAHPPTDNDIEVFLDFLGADGLVEYLAGRGVFFHTGLRVQFLESFYSIALSLATTLPLDHAEAERCLREQYSAAEAAVVYFEENIGRDTLVSRAARSLVDRFRIDPMHGLAAVERVLHQQMQLDGGWRVLKKDFADRLLERFGAAGLLNAAQVSPEDTILIDTPAKKEALAVLGLQSSTTVVKKKVKNRYTRLMKDYHPDINPDGAEKAALINHAYEVLLSDRAGARL